MQKCRGSIFFVFKTVVDACHVPQRPSFARNNFVFKIYESFIMPKIAFYAVARGRNPGIYSTWDTCEAQVNGFPNARYKKFDSNDEAQQFITQHSTVPTTSKNVLVSTSLSNSTLTMTSAASSISKRNFSTTPTVNKTKRKTVATDEIVTGKKKKSSVLGNSSVDLKAFTVDDNGYVVVYTDGACSNNGLSDARAGIGVWFGDNHFLNVSEPVRGRQTSIAAEILAAEQAILRAKEYGIHKLNVFTDSMFVINCMTQWMQKWKEKDWKSSTKKPVVNRIDLEKLDSAMVDMDVKWSYVPGHEGYHGNECADRLAVEGANKP